MTKEYVGDPEPRIIVTLEITDPETVEAYQGVSAELVYEDLRNGTLMRQTALVRCDNSAAERPLSDWL